MKKAAFLVILFILCISLLGVGYAAWNDVLTITGTVNTGTFDVKFTQANSNDAGSTNDPGLPDSIAKNVGSTETVVTNKQVTVTISNGYPGYSSQVSYEITNDGTIPAKVTATVALNSGSEGNISVSDPGINGQEIAPGGTLTFTVTSNVLDNAAEATTYGYTITINAVQFNSNH